ncbi:MAG: MmcQ/YjbR family DNA-binding protein [Clostridia bacterium]|nr:MmcQ/YjbR family DNA-binding protein [Clostridia bacterium]
MNAEWVDRYIADKYGCKADYPFAKYSDYAVYRHKDNRKWFAVVMQIPAEKLGIDKECLITVMNLKCDPLLVGSLRKEKGFFPAYHMNKEKWISVLLDNNSDTEQIKYLIDMSFDLTCK